MFQPLKNLPFLLLFPLVLGLSSKNACKSLIGYTIAQINPNCYNNPDVLSNVTSIVPRHGYLISTFSVTTSDGYILTVYRINSKSKKISKPPVFLQHGIATDSATWVDIGNRSLAFDLADQGYDVWLGNVRGSTYSQAHVSLDVSNYKYWNYNLDTIAANDIPSMLNLVANKTGKAGKIVYIGHSMGTSVIFMYASRFPSEAKSLLQGIITLAPVAYLNNVPSLELAAPLVVPLLDILNFLHIRGLFYQENIIHRALVFLAGLLPIPMRLLLNLIFGRTNQFLPEDLLVYYSYWLGGTSIYQLQQYLQFAASGNFQMYDFGKLKNMEVYGTSKPPEYNLGNLTIACHLFYGKRDSLYNQENVQRLLSNLGSVTKSASSVPANNTKYDFDHIDFIYSENLQQYLYTQMAPVLSTFK